MPQLILLELKKISLKPHFLGLIIANFMILLLTVITSVLISIVSEVMSSMNLSFSLDSLAIASMLVRVVLIIWEAVLISFIIIEEYRTKTITLLYTYPINRSKLIYSKVLFICIISFIFHIISMTFQHIGIFILSKVVENVTYVPSALLTQTVIILCTILLGLLPLCIGMINRSSITTIISSILIAVIASNSQGSNAGILSIPIFAIILGITGALLASFTINKMVTTDLYH